jgi:hypothetical protein
MIYNIGYAEIDGGDYVELYDIEANPEEMNDLSSTNPDLANEIVGRINIGEIFYLHKLTAKQRIPIIIGLFFLRIQISEIEFGKHDESPNGRAGRFPDFCLFMSGTVFGGHLNWIASCFACSTLLCQRLPIHSIN